MSMFGLFGKRDGKKEDQPLMQQSMQQVPVQQVQQRQEPLEKIASEVVIKGGQYEPILVHFVEYPQVVPREFLKIVKNVSHPANVLGYNSNSDIADVLNELELLGLKYKCKPEGVRSDKYARWRLQMTLIRGQLNLSVEGRLIQAVTRFIFPENLRREEL